MTRPHDPVHDFELPGTVIDLKVSAASADRQLKSYAELARRWGLYVTSATQPKEKASMPPTNPYDRRNAPRYDGTSVMGAARHAAQDNGDGLSRPPAHGYSEHSGRRLYDVAGQRLEMADEVDHLGLTLRDIETLVAAKVRKARRDGDDAAYMREQGKIVDAQREAWEQGRVTGQAERGEQVHRAYEEALGAKVHDLHVRAVAIVEADAKTKAGRELRTVANLLDFALRVAHVTDEAIRLHGKELAHVAAVGHSNMDVPF